MLIYLASPYQHEDRNIMIDRFETVRAITAQLISEQDHVIPYSPIVYTHDLSDYVDADFDWRDWDIHILEKCDVMVVLMMDGWKESKGVQKEIAYCEKVKKQTIYVGIDDINMFIKDCKKGCLF